MKVLYLNSGNLFGGIETLLLTFARSRHIYPRIQPEFGVCFEGTFSQRLRESGVPVHLLGNARLSNPWTSWKSRRRLALVLAESKPDIVVAHGSWSLAILGPAVRKARLPLVYWTHDRTTAPLPWQERLAARCEPDFVVCNSEYTASGQKALFENCPRQVIYCALTPPEGIPSAREIEAFRIKQNTPPGAKVILQLSRLDPHKGHRLHLEALSKIKGRAWVCWIVAGPQRPAEEELLNELKSMAERLGISSQVRFLGWQPDINVVFSAADIFCQPNSGPEPFGLTFVEALWRGKPVVSTAMAGALEVVSESCGILTPPGDVDSLAEAIRSLVENCGLRERLGAAGPARAAHLCDPAQRLEQMHRCFQGIVETAGARAGER